MPGSVDRVEPQLAVGALVLVVAQGLEDGAVGHGAGVDVQAHGHGIIAGVADGVVLVGRDQAAGGAGAGLDGAHGLEAVVAVFVGEALVLDHFQGAAPYAFYAPHAAVVMDRGALAGSPGHGDHAVAVILAAVELAAGVAAFGGFEDAFGKRHGLAADEAAQAVAEAVRDGSGGVLRHGGIDGVDELAGAGEIQGKHGVLDGSCYGPILAAPARGRRSAVQRAPRKPPMARL